MGAFKEKNNEIKNKQKDNNLNSKNKDEIINSANVKPEKQDIIENRLKNSSVKDKID